MASNRFIYYILAAFITGTLLLIFIQYNSVKNINVLIRGNEQLLNEFKVEAELRDLRKNIQSVETVISNAVNAGDTTHTTNLQTEIAAAESNLGNLQKIDDNDSSVKYIDQLDELVHKKIIFNDRVLQTFYTTGKMAAGSLIKNGKEKELTDSIAFVTHKIDSTRRYLLTVLTASVDKGGQNARKWGIILFIMVGCSGAALFWFIIDRVRKQNHLIFQLDASEKKVKEAARVKENFIANMSHEIRTPLNAIIGFTGLLQKKNLDADAGLYVESIQKSGTSLLTIVNDILDLSKLEAGMMRIESFPFSIREMLHSIETMFHEKAREKNLLLSVVVSENIPDILEADATRLTQVLVNLIGNAIKFTEAGSVRINAGAREINDRSIVLSIVITDTGIGMDQKQLPDIFERFRQAESSITRKYGGTGLGLSIVKDLVVLQKGEITVESKPGQGSTFSFTLPCKISPAAKPGTSAYKSANNVSAIFPNGHVLVVEDNEMNQRLMKHLLGQWQLSFTIANSGQQAIEQLKENSFDLVLMDIQMPEMDGYATAELIRLQLQLDIPIVAMTAHVLAGEKEKCISHGMNDYISKPINEKQLLDIISHYIALPANASATDEKRPDTINPDNYTCINLQYMREISNGDTSYEKAVTEQFIEAIPSAIAILESALRTKDFDKIKQVAHNMKTTISVMGLTDRLQSSLDALEYDPADELLYSRHIESIKQTCNKALTEACRFYSTL